MVADAVSRVTEPSQHCWRACWSSASSARLAATWAGPVWQLHSQQGFESFTIIIMVHFLNLLEFDKNIFSVGLLYYYLVVVDADSDYDFTSIAPYNFSRVNKKLFIKKKSYLILFATSDSKEQPRRICEPLECWTTWTSQRFKLTFSSIHFLNLMKRTNLTHAVDHSALATSK